MKLEDKIRQGHDLSGGEIEYGDKLAHFEKCLLTNKAMKGQYSEDDRSYRDGRSYGDSYRNGRRDSMGRYSRDGFMDHLMSLRESAPDERSRHAVDKMMRELEN